MRPRPAVVTVTPIFARAPRVASPTAGDVPDSAMAMLDILEFPDPRLRTVAEPVEPRSVTTPAFQQLLDDMFETMYEAPGIGLAATQVDVHQRFMVIDVSEDKTRRRWCSSTPRSSSARASRSTRKAACRCPASSPTSRAPTRSRVRAHRSRRPAVRAEADGLLAVCMQHEMDHLAGKLFVDYLSPLKREMVRKKLAKAAPRSAARSRAGIASDGQSPMTPVPASRRFLPDSRSAHAIVFAGTPEFAVPACAPPPQRSEVVAVYTQPDRPAGRGRGLAPSPVKQEALAARHPGAAAGELPKTPMSQRRAARAASRT